MAITLPWVSKTVAFLPRPLNVNTCFDDGSNMIASGLSPVVFTSLMRLSVFRSKIDIMLTRPLEMNPRPPS